MRARLLTVLTATALVAGASLATAPAGSTPAELSDPPTAPAAIPACTEAPFTDVPLDHLFCADIAWLADQGITSGYADGGFHPLDAVSRKAMAAFLEAAADGEGICDPDRFPDVGGTDPFTGPDPFCGPITWLADQGITGGFGDGTFGPNKAVSRQSMATFVQRWYSLETTGSLAPPPACTEAPFTDVAMDHPFCAPIAWLKAEGLASGYADGHFGPTEPISRQAAAAFLARLAARDDGYVDRAWFTARQDDYLTHATSSRSTGSILNLLNHLERADRDPGFTPVDVNVGPEAFQSSWDKIEGYADTADFDMLYLVNLWYAQGEDLDPALRQRIEQAMVDFKYWYDDPTPVDQQDDRWYWSENHRIIFHALEYLAGQAFPDTVFTITGLTGAQHQARAAALIDEWLVEKARFGFSEWHSDVYYQKDVTPLLTLVEFADDPVLAERAAAILDLVLLDLAQHTIDGNNGATHGRSYMKDKSIATDEDVFGIVKLLFDDTDEPWTSNGEAGASLLARAQHYRLPEAIRAVATSDRTTVDHEHMGVDAGVEQPIIKHPAYAVAPYGYDYDDPANVAFWWERGALTAWPFVPTTLDTIEGLGLWDSPSFAAFASLRNLIYDEESGTYNYPAAQSIANVGRKIINVGLLDEVNTTTYRTGDVMLSSAQDYRPGARGEQYHAWQATLGSRALVFTTHPGNLPRTGDRWADGDMYWTGTASMPRTAQHGPAAIHIYAPAYESGLAPFQDFPYLDETHAWFPTEEFDEVTRSDGWTFGRKDGGYVALWSYRPTEWRTHAPDVVNQNGLTEDFDLVATGGADNVWIVEVADAEDWGDDFAAFQAAMVAAPPAVTDLPAAGKTNPYGGFDVSWQSPTQGLLTFGTTGAFTVGGTPVDLHPEARLDSTWVQAPFDRGTVEVRIGLRRLDLDLDTWTRTAG